MKNIITFFLIFYSSLLYCQKDSIEIKKVIESFFEEMKNAESSNMKLLLSDQIILQTATNDSVDLVKTQEMSVLLDSIKKFKKGDLDERVNINNIKTDGTIASAWMTYAFYYRGIKSHCGINSIQLIKNKQNKWKIHYILDTKNKCIN